MSLSELVRCNIPLLRKGININTSTTRNHLRLLAIGRRTYSTPRPDTSLKTKVWDSIEEAIQDVRSGQIVLVGGFGLAPRHRTKGGVYAKKEEGILTIKRRKRGGTDICGRPAEKRVHPTL